ncbi:hypothetical protein [Chryseobacterium hagamense]|uniref:Uncharacterized protein n=1 Tax=Chryseobacterium hagamense TaxID=395935 RepID=A0A511YLE8_9FLAO|nr:hypothetical protein [Chryseobacterium hagamense]GEN76027.1 hypothetical protein CHA01nite_17670 [Chryseobacterium hagamense]
MNLNQKKFEDIKKVLIDRLGDEVEYSKDEDGTESLALKNSEFWISTTFGELVVGYGVHHTHFSEAFGNLDDGIVQAFDLLTNRVRTTNYLKGNTVFKTVVEIEYPDATLVDIGNSGLVLFPFWKKTKLKVKYDEKILEKKEIVDQVNAILENLN